MRESVTPWGLTRMQPYPRTVVLPAAEVVLDPVTQTGRWVGPDGLEAPTARHKRSETSKETSTKTSLDGNTDEGSDQEGDSD
ncbi:putative ATP-grasp-modified RiPP [Streptomyces sp. A73]|uniref:putative ATP-grasp-modified RiPP n=1 Tax=Streptomyces smyrnaeus TaxID=1387713 RepID=UPI001B4DC92D|nr:putative ATP-grasp-modified RiPP [Streptomyces sp. A73]